MEARGQLYAVVPLLMRSFVTLFLDFFMPNKNCNHRMIGENLGRQEDCM
jgi:hypothetical protein